VLNSAATVVRLLCFQASGKCTESASYRLFTKTKLNGVDSNYRPSQNYKSVELEARSEFYSELPVPPPVRKHRVVLFIVYVCWSSSVRC